MVQINARAHGLVTDRGGCTDLASPEECREAQSLAQKGLWMSPSLLFLMGKLLIRQEWFYGISC